MWFKNLVLKTWFCYNSSIVAFEYAVESTSTSFCCWLLNVWVILLLNVQALFCNCLLFGWHFVFLVQQVFFSIGQYHAQCHFYLYFDWLHSLSFAKCVGLRIYSYPSRRNGFHLNWVLNLHRQKRRNGKRSCRRRIGRKLLKGWSVRWLQWQGIEHGLKNWQTCNALRKRRRRPWLDCCNFLAPYNLDVWTLILVFLKCCPLFIHGVKSCCWVVRVFLFTIIYILVRPGNAFRPSFGFR